MIVKLIQEPFPWIFALLCIFLHYTFLPKNSPTKILLILLYLLGFTEISFSLLPLLSLSSFLSWTLVLLWGAFLLYLSLFSWLGGEFTPRSFLSFLPLTFLLQNYLLLGLWSSLHSLPLSLSHLSFLRYSLLLLLTIYLLLRFYLPKAHSPWIQSLFFSLREFFYETWIHLFLLFVNHFQQSLIPRIIHLLSIRKSPWVFYYRPCLFFLWLFPPLLLTLGQMIALLWFKDISWSLIFLPSLIFFHFHEIFSQAWDLFNQVNRDSLGEKISRLEKNLEDDEIIRENYRYLAYVRNLSLLHREYSFYFQERAPHWIPPRLFLLSFLWLYLSYLTLVDLPFFLTLPLFISRPIQNLPLSRNFSVRSAAVNWDFQKSLEKSTQGVFQKGHFLAFDDEEYFINQKNEVFFFLRGSWTSGHPKAHSVSKFLNVKGESKEQKIIFFTEPVVIPSYDLHPLDSPLTEDPFFQKILVNLFSKYSPGYSSSMVAKARNGVVHSSLLSQARAQGLLDKLPESTPSSSSPSPNSSFPPDSTNL